MPFYTFQEVLMIVFFCNGEKWEHIGAICKIALKSGYHYYITDSVVEVSEILARIVKDKVKIVCVLGGDGTICQLVSAIFRQQELTKEEWTVPQIAVLGGGTMNNLFYILKNKGSPPKVAQKIVSGYQTNNLKINKIPLLRLEHNGKIYFGFMFVLGPIVRLLKKYTDDERSVYKAALTAGFSCLAALTKKPKSFASLIYPAKSKIIIDGKTELPFSEITGVLASTVSRTVFGFRPFLGEEEKISSCFRKLYTIASGLSPKELVLKIPYLGKAQFWQKYFPSLPLFENRFYFNQLSSSIVITTDENFFTIDGEIFEIQKNKEIKLSFGPEIPLITF
jgi:hypothetical protein